MIGEVVGECHYTIMISKTISNSNLAIYQKKKSLSAKYCWLIVGGVWSNSLAIATDAAHLLTDFASFMISLFSIWVASRPATRRMPFGWYRAEVIIIENHSL